MEKTKAENIADVRLDFNVTVYSSSLEIILSCFLFPPKVMVSHVVFKVVTAVMFLISTFVMEITTVPMEKMRGCVVRNMLLQ